MRIAIITAYGMSTGGTEKFLQTVAKCLPKDKYQVDYYYIDNDASRCSNIKKQQLIDAGVSLIPYQVERYDIRYDYMRQVNSNFFSVYHTKYDLIFSGVCGLAEEPFVYIHDTPIVQSIHYVSGVDNQYNIARVLHISEFSKRLWVELGGDEERTEMISHPICIPEYKTVNVREKFEISKDCFVFGMHQRNNDDIFSDIPLKAYQKIESMDNAFIMCGGSEKYRKQAKQLGLKRCYFIPATDSPDIIYSFLKAIDVYAHGRRDGELNSTALAEAMYFGLPIVSHPSTEFNGHLEVIKDNGFVAKDVTEYANYMEMLEKDTMLYQKCAIASKGMYQMKYDEKTQMQNIINIMDEVLDNPYPNHDKRFALDKVSQRKQRLSRLKMKIFFWRK